VSSHARRELQLQLLRRDNDNNEMKKATEQTLQEWNEVQTMWELMAKQMNGLEQALFPLDDDSLQRIGSSLSPLSPSWPSFELVVSRVSRRPLCHLQAHRARQASSRGTTARSLRQARRRSSCPSADSSGSLPFSREEEERPHAVPCLLVHQTNRTSLSPRRECCSWWQLSNQVWLGVTEGVVEGEGSSRAKRWAKPKGTGWTTA
jgi:hypothetical protein